MANRRLGKMWGRSRVPVARPLWRDRGAWRPAPAAHLGQRSAPRVRSATPARTCSPPNPDNCRRRRRPPRTDVRPAPASVPHRLPFPRLPPWSRAPSGLAAPRRSPQPPVTGRWLCCHNIAVVSLVPFNGCGVSHGIVPP